MKIKVSKEAALWFEEEVGIPEGSGIRFLPKVYGSTPLHEGFSLGIESNEPQEIGAEFRAANGLLFYVEAADLWFFDQHDLDVQLDQELHEPKYSYLKDGQRLGH